MEFKVGTPVKLKSGGPSMTVFSIIGSSEAGAGQKLNHNLLKHGGYKDGDVICQWFVGSKLELAPFKIEMIESAE